jgi:hypothetical protein
MRSPASALAVPCQITLAGMLTMNAASSLAGASGPPLPTARQLEWMDLETIQFMHFSIPTAWNPPDAFLRR